jgi:TRAP-type uncharacterized transport system substrate-binding protein
MRLRATALRPLLGAVLVLATMGSCSTSASGSQGRYHNGLLFLATGNTTGTYYQFGGGYADLVTKYLPGYEVRAEPTGASGENISRVDSGDMDLALSHADTQPTGHSARGSSQASRSGSSRSPGCTTISPRSWSAAA